MRRLAHILPSIAKELEAALFDMGEYRLARSVDHLEIVDRCRCGDEACGTFYTVNRRDWQDKPLRHVVSDFTGHCDVGICDGHIVCVEILDRDDVGDLLRERLP